MVNWAGLNQPDPILGYRARPSESLMDVGYKNGAVWYSARYTTDVYGRRVTPLFDPRPRPQFIALFGCSIAFGLCLNDDQTLEAWLGRYAPEYMPYNFGYQGYGPQHVMLTLQEPLQNEILQPCGIGLYIFDASHIRRAIGSMVVSTNWGMSFPSYRLENGGVAFEGSFSSAHPWRQRFYGLLHESRLVVCSGFDVPVFLRDKDFELTARIIRQAAQSFHEKWPESEFYVVFYPREGTAATLCAFMPYLDRYGIKYLYPPGLFEGRLPVSARTVDGGHPTSAANRLMAQWLTRTLHLHLRENALRDAVLSP